LDPDVVDVGVAATALVVGHLLEALGDSAEWLARDACDTDVVANYDTCHPKKTSDGASLARLQSYGEPEILVRGDWLLRVRLDWSHADGATAIGDAGRIDCREVARAARVGDTGSAISERASRSRPGR